MSRSIRVAPECIPKVKLALKRHGFPSQKSLAQELGFAYATVSKFFNGKPVDYRNFVEITEKLGLDWQAISYIEEELLTQTESSPLPKTPQNAESESIGVVEFVRRETELATRRHEQLQELQIDSPSNVPAGIRDPNRFVGREDELQALHELLHSRGQVAIAAVFGMGGLGKTELAIQYARRYRHHYPKGICWLRAGGEYNIPTQVLNFSLENFPNFILNRELPAESQVRLCWRQWLTPTPGKMLVILDDVTDYGTVQPYLPEDLAQMRVLVNTRFRLSSDFAELALNVLQPSDAIALVKLLVGEDRIERQLADSERLCKWMEYLPLGLELVGRYLELEQHLTVGEMLTELQIRGLKHDAMHRDQADPWPITAERGVAAAFELSWEKLDHQTRRVCCLLSLFAAAPIPWVLVEVAEEYRCRFAESGEEFNRENLQRARRNLLRLYLLEDAGAATYRLHQLMRKFLREKLEESASAD